MAVTLCADTDVKLKAGENISTNLDQAEIEIFINQSEATINSICRFDWVAAFAAGLADNFKLILEDVCSSMAAMKCISYDMGGYTSLSEAQTMLDVNKDIESEVSLIKNILEKIPPAPTEGPLYEKYRQRVKSYGVQQLWDRYAVKFHAEAKKRQLEAINPQLETQP